MTPIIINMEEAVKHYSIKKKDGKSYIRMGQRCGIYVLVTIKEVTDNEEASVQAYTDGSKHEQGVGSGAAIFIGKEIVAQIMLKLDSRCSNNQAEQLAIFKALEAIESLHSKQSTHVQLPYSPTVGLHWIRFVTSTTTPTFLKRSGRGYLAWRDTNGR